MQYIPVNVSLRHKFSVAQLASAFDCYEGYAFWPSRGSQFKPVRGSLPFAWVVSFEYHDEA